MGICVSPGQAIPAEGADERGINCGLLAVPQGQPVADNLDALGVLHGHVQVHISQAHIPGHTCASLAAYPGECSLKRGGARGKDAGGGARRSVITRHVKRPAASAGPRCKWERQVQPAKEENTKMRTEECPHVWVEPQGHARNAARPVTAAALEKQVEGSFFFLGPLHLHHSPSRQA